MSKKVEMIDVAYKLGDNLEKAIKAFEAKGCWSVLTTSHSDLASAPSEFKAVAFFNKETREVVMAHAGTKLNSINRAKEDIRADGLLMAGHVPTGKFKALESFISKVTQELSANNIDPMDCTFSTTGHSLGGVLSDLAAAKLTDLGFRVSESITFENPGSAPVIRKAIDRGLLEKVTVDSLKSSTEFVSYQAQASNLINTTNEQFGKTKIIVSKPKVAASHEQAEVDAHEVASEGYASYLYNKVGSVVSSVASYLNLTESVQIIAEMYNPTTYTELLEDVEIIKNGLIKKLEEESAPFLAVRDDLVNVMKDISAIAAGVTGAYNGSLTMGLSAVVGVRSLVTNGLKLGSDVVKAYNKAASFLSRVAELKGHSLANFAELDENNAFDVVSERNAKTAIEVDKSKLEDLKGFIANKAPEVTTVAAPSLMSSIYDATIGKVAKLIARDVEEANGIDVKCGSEKLHVSHQDLQSFMLCTKNPMNICDFEDSGVRLAVADFDYDFIDVAGEDCSAVAAA